MGDMRSVTCSTALFMREVKKMHDDTKSDGTTRQPDLLESFADTFTGVEKPVSHTTTNDDGEPVVGHGRTAEEARQDAENKK